MSTKKYCYCDNNCKYETLSKEEIITAITQAVSKGTISNIDTGFITTIKTINGVPLKFFVGTQAEYNALTATQKQGLYAIVTDDTTAENMANAIEALDTELTEYKKAIDLEFTERFEQPEMEEKSAVSKLPTAGLYNIYFQVKSIYESSNKRRYCTGVFYWDGEHETRLPTIIDAYAKKSIYPFISEYGEIKISEGDDLSMTSYPTYLSILKLA